MKKIISLIIVLFTIINQASAINYTWTLTTSGSANSAASWAPAGIPGLNDNVIFNGTSTTNCSWNIPAIGGFSVLSGYTGVITMSSGPKTIKNNIVINSGTVIATSGTITKSFLGSATMFSLGAGGVFNHNSGTFLLQIESFDNYLFVGNIVLNTLNIGGGISGSERHIDFGSNLIVNNVLYSHLNFPDPVSYEGTIHIKSSMDLSSNSSTDPLFGTNNANFIFDGANASIIGATGVDISILPNIQIDVPGSYSITNHVNLDGNWVHSQGTLASGTSNENFYGTAATVSGVSPAFHNLNIEAGADVTLPASEVKISGSLVMTGTLNVQTTTALGLNGTGSQSIALGGKTLAAINSYSSSGSRTITLSGAIDVLDSIRVEPTVTLNTGGNLTLKSNASLTARIGRLGGAFGGAVSGNVIVETFIPGGSTGWANLGVRGVNGQSVVNWDTHASSGGLNGIPMTCVGCTYDPTVIPTPFTSVQSWDETFGTYSDLVSGDPMDPGVGRWVYVGSGQFNTSGLTLINTGSIAQGNISVPVTAAGTGTDVGFNLVANPYPSPISYTKLMGDFGNSFDFTGSAYFWNADESSGAGGYVSFNGVVSSPIGYNGDVIAGGQGFYIEYTGGFGLNLLSFDEGMKVDNSGGAAPLLKSAASSTLSYFRLKLDGVNDGDETVISINPTATNLFDRKHDARKILQTPGYIGYPGNYTHYTTLSSKDANGKDYSINTLPTLSKNETVPIMVRVSSSGTYTLSSFDFNNFENCLVLIDKLDNSYHDLRVAPYAFTINDTTSAPRFELVLCKNQTDVITAITETKADQSSILINQDQEGAFVKTSFVQNTKATISVFNIIGQKLMEDVEVEGTITNTRLNLDLHHQVIFIRVMSEKENTTKKMLLH
jgi:hypothetical protein